MTIESIAQVAHEVNKAYCESINDHSQMPWDEAPENIKASAIDGVKFHLQNPDADPKSSHENWMRGKEADGWKWGPVKDAEKKEHPCFIAYEELLTDQKSKDYLFRQVVHSLKPFLDPVPEKALSVNQQGEITE